jgi:tRNA (mo5U34)-methyltransferase
VPSLFSPSKDVGKLRRDDREVACSRCSDLEQTDAARITEGEMASATVPSREQLIAEISNLEWAQTIDLGDGVVTPGAWGNHSPVLWQAIRDLDFQGKKVLDIGCWDGLWSFEAEKRGAAEVYSTDLITQRSHQMPTFELAHQLLNSKAKYFPQLSVYDIESLGIDDFDVVLFAGVYYHLKDPLRALTCLRRVMKEGGVLLVEGAVIDLDEPKPSAVAPPAPAPIHRRIRRRLGRWLRADPPAPPAAPPRPAPGDCYARFYYRNAFAHDTSNWWVPTPSCLRQWVECTFFEVERDYGKWDAGGENMRYVLTARAVCREDRLYCRPDDDLSSFDRNQYPWKTARGG